MLPTILSDPFLFLSLSLSPSLYFTQNTRYDRRETRLDLIYAFLLKAISPLRDEKLGYLTPSIQRGGFPSFRCIFGIGY